MPKVFWITLFSLPLLLFWLTLAGAAWLPLLPWRLRAGARFYLSPALGLASFTLAATVCGWLLPFARGWPWLALVMLALAGTGWRGSKSVQHALWVALFGVVCSGSLLAPLAMYGSFNNPFNDALTYLQHAQWLQHHAFSDTIIQIQPDNVQVMLYQESRLRMGASFVFAGWQAILHIQQPFDVYSSIMGAGLAVACWSLGWPLMRLLRPLPRYLRYMVLSLPALTLGGLVFGANAAFMPQTIGLALAAPALFLIGASLHWLHWLSNRHSPPHAGMAAGRYSVPNSVPNSASISAPISAPISASISAPILWRLAVPAALLLAAAIFAYSELAPFLALALAGCIALLWLQSAASGRRTIPIYGMALLLLLCGILNAELLRLVTALRLQAGAVVGTGVAWSASGFLAHAFGLHGGVWDGFQWSAQRGSRAFVLGWLLLALPLLCLWRSAGSLWRATRGGLLLPGVLMLGGLALALLVFRYAVPSPFPVGTGQSWSQFKLSEWAHPFVMLMVLWAVLSLRPRRLPRPLVWGAGALWLFGLGLSWHQGAARLQPWMSTYAGIHDMRQLHRQLRLAADRVCAPQAPVFLDIDSPHVHFRQMAVVFFADRALRSDWRSDPYFARLPQQEQELNAGDCVIESGPEIGPAQNTASSANLQRLRTPEHWGPFRIGPLRPDLDFVLGTVSGAYARESDKQYWWHWVEHKAQFRLKALTQRQGNNVRLRFEYMAHTPQSLRLAWRTIDGMEGHVELPEAKRTGQWIKIDQLIPVEPRKLQQISLETNAVASRLGEQDARLAAFAVANLLATTP